MREKFEAWISASGRAHLLERDETHDWYKDLTVTAWWTAWQAAYAAGMERAAEICEGQWKIATEFECAAAIRAEIKRAENG